MTESSRPWVGSSLESPVPEAMGRLLAFVRERIETGTMDKVWVFPPLVRGRKEWGLVAVSCRTDDPSSRKLVTGKYLAELTGQGVEFQPELTAEGAAPPDRLSRIMDGVVLRSDLPLGVPTETEIAGDGQRFNRLLKEHGWGDDEVPPVQS